MIEDFGQKSSSALARVMNYLRTPFLAALIVLVTDCILLFAGFRVIALRTLVLVLFLEAGMGFMAGTGIALSSTPSIAKVGHTLFGTATWSRDSEKHAERVGWKWILTAGFLVAIGFTVSSIA